MSVGSLFDESGHEPALDALPVPPSLAAFAGAEYQPADDVRLTGQLLRVYDLMKDGRWRTAAEIAAATGDPQPSVVAQLGHLRKARFGAYPVEKRRRNGPDGNLWEYQVGEKGAGQPRRDPNLVRAELAEERLRLVAAALRQVDPANMVLRQLGL